MSKEKEIERSIEVFAEGFEQGAKPGARVKREYAGSFLLDFQAGQRAGELARAMAVAEYTMHAMGQADWPLPAGEHRHCDDYIHDRGYPLCLRGWLLRQRTPAVDGMLMAEAGFQPKLYATFEFKRMRVTMASRFGDVGISSDLAAEHGYEKRCWLDQLSDFSDTP